MSVWMSPDAEVELYISYSLTEKQMNLINEKMKEIGIDGKLINEKDEEIGINGKITVEKFLCCRFKGINSHKLDGDECTVCKYFCKKLIPEIADDELYRIEWNEFP